MSAGHFVFLYPRTTNVSETSDNNNSDIQIWRWTEIWISQNVDNQFTTGRQLVLKLYIVSKLAALPREYPGQQENEMETSLPIFKLLELILFENILGDYLLSYTKHPIDSSWKSNKVVSCFRIFLLTLTSGFVKEEIRKLRLETLSHTSFIPFERLRLILQVMIHLLSL